MNKKISDILDVGNFNLCLRKIHELQGAEHASSLASVKKTLDGATDLFLNEQSLQTLKLKNSPVIPCPHRLLIPFYSKNRQQAGISIPEFQIVFPPCRQQDPALRESFNSAYQHLLTVLWQLEPFAYVQPDTYSFKITVPGGKVFQAEGTEGRSASLGFLVGMLMAISNLRLDKTVAITGCLDRDNITKVGNIKEKIAAVFRERDDVDLVLIPASHSKEYKRLDQRIVLVKNVEQVLKICFGQDWQQNMWSMPMRHQNVETFFTAATAAEKDYDAEHAQMLYTHLCDLLEKRKDSSSRIFWVKAFHRLAELEAYDPSKRFHYLRMASDTLVKLKKDGLHDPQEEVKLLTSFVRPLLQSCEFGEAFKKNEAALRLQRSDITRLPNLSLKAEILVHQMRYEEAESILLEAYRIAQRAGFQDLHEYWEREERQLNWLLKLYTLWEKWDKGLEVYKNVPDKEPSGDFIGAEMEFLASWANLCPSSFPQELQLVLKKRIQQHRAKAKAPYPYCVGLAYVSMEKWREAQKSLEKAESTFGFAPYHNLSAKSFRIVPFVWRLYALSMTTGVCQFDEDSMSVVRGVQYAFELKDLEVPFREHAAKWEQVTQGYHEMKQWCQGFRKLLCW